MTPEEEINKELKDIAPGFPLKESFEAPSGYFESLPEEILNRWKKTESQPVVKTINWKSIIGIAAMLIGLCLGGWWIFSKPTLSHTDDITSLEAYQYINEHIDEFETLIETSDIQAEETQMDIPNDAIEEYLMEEMHGTNPEDLF